MMDRSNAKLLLRTHSRFIKSRLNRFYSSTLESKAARTFTDDVYFEKHIEHRQQLGFRPGQRDDENNNLFGKIMPSLQI